MTSLIARRVRAVLGVAAVAALVWPAVPARAAPPQVTVGVADVATSNPVKMDVTAAMRVIDPGVDGQIRSITIRVGGINVPAPFTKDFGTSGRREESVSWSPTLAYNGQYSLTAIAVGREWQGSDETTQVSRSFAVEVAPVAPTGIKVVSDAKKRTVAISWDQNPEPDIRGYWVERAFNDGSFAEIGTTDNRCDGETRRCAVADDLKGAPAGEYRYRVAAIRPDRGGEESIARKFAPSSDVASTRMAAPTTAPTGGTNSKGGLGSGTTSGSGVSGGGVTRSGTARTGKVNLDGFAASLPQRQRIFVPGEDPGFESELPFDGQEPSEPGQSQEPDEVAILRERPAQSQAESHAPLLFVAAGLLATVLLMHVLWLKSEVEKVSLDPVSPTAD